MPHQPRVIPAVTRALIEAFAYDELETLVAEVVDEDVTPLKPVLGETRVYFKNVVTFLNHRDLLSDVVLEARKIRPRSASLMKAAEELGLSAAARVDFEGSKQSLEKVVRDTRQRVDIIRLRSSIGFAEQRTALVETSGSSFGTAFLIGADRVMTNWHVAEVISDGTVSPSSVRFRFDFKRDQRKTFPGTAVGLAADFLVHHRPYSEFDVSPPVQPDPSINELDFAVLALEWPIGQEDMANPIFAESTQRGWFDLAGHAAPPSAGEPIYLLGHPGDEPLTASMGKILAHVGQGRRIRHDAWTLGGSSGSPVFDGNGSLVALHHGTQPLSGAKALFNQAVPMSLIVADCRDRGI